MVENVTVVRRQAAYRWLVVGAVVAALCVTPSVVAAWPVTAVRVAPTVLHQRIQASARQPFEGYALSTASLGLPDLPRLSDVTSLLNGSTQLRAWYAAPKRWRVDVVDTVGERDLYQTADSQYQWDYGANLLTRVVGTQPARLPRGADLLPTELARRLLAGATADQLSALPAKRIAGLAAAGLRVTPANPSTTIGYIDVWAVPATGFPLRVEVTGRGAGAPILVTRFLDLRLGTPSSAALTPPTVGPDVGRAETHTPDIVSALGGLGLGILPATLAGLPRTGPLPGVQGVSAYGTGLSQFVVLPVPRRIGFEALRSAEQAGGADLPFPAGEGRLLTTPLLTVVVMQSTAARRTYVLAGLVNGDLLKQAGAELSTFTPVRR
jgi:hypothetical protein